MTGGRFRSSTRDIPEVSAVPRHIAIIMDGNGRWARKRLMPRVAGHSRGVEALRAVIRGCIEQGVEYLTVFAFSSENWRRPQDEVSVLMRLFITALEREVAQLRANGIRLRVAGDVGAFEGRLQSLIRDAEHRTAHNTRMTLTVAANYGGRWDIVQATRALLRARPECAAHPELITEEALSSHMALAHAPEPDLFIRTGGEQRISNFMLWQLAYTEFYFTDVFWPDFGPDALARALASYRDRERRFGRISAQVATA